MVNQSIPTIKHFTALILNSQVGDTWVEVKKLGMTIINELNLKTVREYYYQFKPMGITYCFILSQSHLIIHTYPENQMIHIDLVACVNIDKKDFKMAIKKFFSHQDFLSVKIKEVKYF